MSSRRHSQELVCFAVVGASGVLINMAAMVVLTLVGPSVQEVLIVGWLRWYHAYSVIAFIVANGWNFYFNRRFTFRSTGPWVAQYRAFLLIGILAQMIGLGVLTMLMSPQSPLALPVNIFDDSTWWRTQVYAAQLLTIVVVTPLSFGLNKAWTFRSKGSLTTTAAPPHHYH